MNNSISKGEYKILMEDAKQAWEWFEEEYIENHKKKPTAEQKEKFIKKYIKENAIKKEKPMRQAEKENGQLTYLRGALVGIKNHMSLEQMSQYLIRLGFKRGSSVKTIYRRILPELLSEGLIKDEEGKFYFQEPEEEAEEKMITQSEMTQCIDALSSLTKYIKDDVLRDKVNNFLDYEKQSANYLSYLKKENRFYYK